MFTLGLIVGLLLGAPIGLMALAMVAIRCDQR